MGDLRKLNANIQEARNHYAEFKDARKDFLLAARKSKSIDEWLENRANARAMKREMAKLERQISFFEADIDRARSEEHERER